LHLCLGEIVLAAPQGVVGVESDQGDRRLAGRLHGYSVRARRDPGTKAGRPWGRPAVLRQFAPESEAVVLRRLAAGALRGGVFLVLLRGKHTVSIRIGLVEDRAELGQRGRLGTAEVAVAVGVQVGPAHLALRLRSGLAGRRL